MQNTLAVNGEGRDQFGHLGACFLDVLSVIGRLQHITCNKNGIPNDPEKPMVTSGIRLGTPAMTTRGFLQEQARMTAHLIADVLEAPDDAQNIEKARAKVAELVAPFPVYGESVLHP